MDPVWDHSTFSKNQDLLLAHQAMELFFTRVVGMAPEGENPRLVLTNQLTNRG